MLSRRSLTRAATVAATASSSSRRGVWTTQHSSALQNVKAERGYKSDLWYGVEDDKWWIERRGGAFKDTARAVSTVLPKRLELVNLSQLRQAPQDAPAEPEEHSSMSTLKPYKGNMAKELQQRALLNDYTSKLWTTPHQVRQKQLSLLPRVRPHVLLLRVPISVINADELVGEAASIARTAINGESGRPVFGDLQATFDAVAAERDLDTPIYFTDASLTDLAPFGLIPKEDAIPVTTASSDIDTWYNIEAFENCEALKLQAASKFEYAADTTAPRYLTTGTVIKQAHVVAALAAAGYTETLWITSKDLQFKEQREPGQMRLAPGAASVSAPSYVGMWYHVSDMTDPEAAMRAVGMATR